MGNSTVATKNGLKKTYECAEKKGTKNALAFSKEENEKCRTGGDFLESYFYGFVACGKKKTGKIMDEPIDLANKVYVRKI